MRVLLLHNPEAGKGEHDAEELMAMLDEAGHEALYQSSKKKGIRTALGKKIDLVLVAGGDGTVGRVARRLVGGNIPLSVLPLGTANNLARTLGFYGPARRLIAQLEKGKLCAFDVGLARGPWGKRYFFEGVGAGLFADYLQESKEAKQSPAATKTLEMKRQVAELRRRLPDYPASEWEISLDGVDFSGSYLLWQAMNIRSVGPVLTLAPNARTDDGKFDFIGARKEDRGLLLDYLAARGAGTNRKLPLSAKKFTKMRVRQKKARLHLDDEPWPGPDEKQSKPRKLELAVKASALGIWR